MKITFVLPHADLTGGVRVVAIYADRLRKRGHDVLVVSTPQGVPNLPQKLKGLLKGNGWPTVPRRSPSHLDRAAVEHRVLEQARPVTDADVPDADVVVATWWETAEWVARLSAAKGTKVYFIQHHEIFDYLPKGRVEATWSLPFHKIVISKWLVDLAQNTYQCDSFSYIPNSVDTEQFHAPIRGKQSTPTIGLLYSKAYWKGCSVSFKAIALAAEKLPELKIITFGAEPLDPELPLPPNAQFFLSPAQDQIKNLYARCDVWLCGSWSEGFHLPPLEAMACRCPVVSTEVGGPIDILENGVNGYLAPTGDSATLAEYLVKVLTLSDADWRKMSDAAYETALRYTWDDATDLFEAALQSAIDRDKGNS